MDRDAFILELLTCAHLLDGDGQKGTARLLKAAAEELSNSISGDYICVDVTTANATERLYRIADDLASKPGDIVRIAIWPNYLSAKKAA